MSIETSAPVALSPLAAALRKKIGWLRQIIRFAVILWSGWILYLIVAGHGASGRHPPFVQPSDLLNAIFVTLLFSLAYIFKTAAELAEDHAQIV
ncbi:hypothetical protein GJ654_16250 [Rhodoblastus acidophilus]|jgi:hypothetical protein|uniref:Uncharacterized protein n=1 Tax=Rhodoblastus acidophilus TaxID=1074 RepID=A0A6N8DQG6_RHOAC|nr:hypothetical protein [Rhodoblastus acidophilus]MCW2274592.1 hypothetical protein [Rhodoblastus acidophilus]MTV32538.1 hypothetical protein [Rhodoblastus acidophilus]